MLIWSRRYAALRDATRFLLDAKLRSLKLEIPMNCPGCNSAETRTAETRTYGPMTMRAHRCEACSGSWASQQLLVPGSFVRSTGSTPVACGQHAGSPKKGGLGGSPGLFSGSESGSDLPLFGPIRSDPDQTRVRQIEEHDPPGFSAFWELFPRKVGKSAARRAWGRTSPPMSKVMATLTWQVVSEEWMKDQGAFVPHPTTWINQGRWDDENPARPPAAPRMFVAPKGKI